MTGNRFSGTLSFVVSSERALVSWIEVESGRVRGSVYKSTVEARSNRAVGMLRRASLIHYPPLCRGIHIGPTSFKASSFHLSFDLVGNRSTTRATPVSEFMQLKSVSHAVEQPRARQGCARLLRAKNMGRL